ncbi:MAG TPA: hypothetical protein VER03_11800 [Bryobacteraceae bacterium]|nr:hypothetical protein [Bryobacteraceae bacterium]
MRIAEVDSHMSDEVRAEEEMERLQGMHETVERLRLQLKTIKLEAPVDDSGREENAPLKLDP